MDKCGCRLADDPFGRVEGGDGIVEGRDVADVGPQAPVPHPLDDLTQLGTIAATTKSIASRPQAAPRAAR